MRWLVACECSGATRRALRALGHDAWSCDLKPAEDASPFHIRGDAILAAYSGQWDGLIAHAECTYVANSGAKHLYLGKRKENGADPERWARLGAGVEFFRTLWRAPIKRKAFEWPIIVGHVRRIWPDFPPVTQIIHPWMFGHFESKATTLRLDGLMPLRPIYTSWQQCRDALGLPAEAKPEQRIWKMGPSESRQTERSRTFDGIAAAFALQWGGDVTNHGPKTVLPPEYVTRRAA